MITSTICEYLRREWTHTSLPSPEKSSNEVRQSIAMGEKEVSVYRGQIPHQTISYELYDAEGRKLTSVTQRSKLFFHATLRANIACGPRYYTNITACKTTRAGTQTCVELRGFVEAEKLQRALEKRKPLLYR